MKHLLLVMLLLLATGCAAKPKDYSAYLEHMPKSVLVLPPVNHTAEVGAPDAFLSTITEPLAERGYYVVPVVLVDNLMKENGLPTPGDMHQAPLDKLGKVFGADAVLYINILKWETNYIVIDSSVHVRLRYLLKDITTGLDLWTWEQEVVLSSSAGQSSLIGMAVSAAITQATSGIAERERSLAIYANNLAINDAHSGMLLGHRHPGFAADQAKRRQEAQAKATANTQAPTPGDSP